ncbi:MAG: hypothetical protein JWR63_2512 [Conexibacter sp.]|nr:hypothetical protein [Conexibacter sp.]
MSLRTAVSTLLLALSLAVAAPASAAPFPFEPIAVKRIDLPSRIKEATRPLFAADGRHVLFHYDRELWISTLKGTHVACLSCGVANSPRSPGEDLATPFPDGKRVFFGGYVQPGPAEMAVLECRPSVADCRTKKILPVDFSRAQPTTIAPGGAVSVPQSNLLGSSTAKLSPDGKHVGFSDLRSDSILNMVVGKLRRAGAKYEVTDPRVINPAGPASATDPRVAGWSDSSALYEFKSFAHGGAEATYVQVGGINRGPDVWSVNLKTGKRTRLTAHPDWDEDDAVSPDGKVMALWSNRTMHFTDWLQGLLPVRDFIGAPAAVMASGAIGANKMCHGPMWLLPSSGDQGGTLAGQPIVDYDYPDVSVTNNLTGAPQWSPDGTMLALNTNLAKQPYDPPRGRNAPFLLVARLTARKPARPLRTVSSDVGAWAPAASDYHGAMGFKGTVSLAGPGGGTVTVTYGGEPGPGAFLGGQWTETYTDYSDDGTDVVNGTVKVTGLTEGTYSAHLTMTGRHTGTQDAELVMKRLSVTGHAESTLDGKTISGPQADMLDGGACPSLLPKKPALHVTARSAGKGVYRLSVTASIAGMGATESSVDTRPVDHATIAVGGRSTVTDAHGVATVTVHAARARVTVTAGTTLAPTSISLEGR